MRRIRIINSMDIEPDEKTNYVIAFGLDTLNPSGPNSVERYIQICIDNNRETLVFAR